MHDHERVAERALRGGSRRRRAGARVTAAACVAALLAAAGAQAADWPPAAPDEAGEPGPPEIGRLALRMTGEDGPYRAVDVAPDGRVVLGGPDTLVMLDAEGKVLFDLGLAVTTFSAAAGDVVWAVRKPRGRPARVVRWMPGASRVEAWSPPVSEDGSIPDVDAVFAMGAGRAVVAVEGSLHAFRAPTGGSAAVVTRLPTARAVWRAVGAPRRLGPGRFVHLASCRRFSGPVAGFVVVRECAATLVDVRDGSARELFEAVDDVAAVAGGRAAAVDGASLRIVAEDGTEERHPLPPGIEGDAMLVAADGDGTIHLVGQTSRRVWRFTDGTYRQAETLPMSIGRPVAAVTSDGGRGVDVLGVGGLARVEAGVPTRVVHRVSALESIPAAVLLVPLLVILAGGLAVGGLAVYLVARARRGPDRWSLVDAAVAVALFTFGQMFGLLIWLAIGGRARLGSAGDIPNEAIALSFLAGGTLASGWILRCLNRRGLPLASIGWRWDELRADAVRGALLVIPAYATVFAFGLVAGWLDLPAFLYTQEGTTGLADRTDVVSVVSLVAMAVLFAPLFEEVVFRGMVLRTLEHRWGPGVALAVTSFLFGLAHVEGIATTLILGVWFGWITLKTRRLGAAIVAHALVNAISLVLLFSGLAG